MAQIPSTELATLSNDAFLEVLGSHAKAKERSRTTFENVHKLALEALNEALANNGIASIRPVAGLPVEEMGKNATQSKENTSDKLQVIGNSHLEHLKTLPTDTQSLEKDSNAASQQRDVSCSFSIDSNQQSMSQRSIRIARIPCSLNLGVGGDKIENVLYRLFLGTYNLLLPHSQSLKVVVVQIGTNNLRRKCILASRELWKYGLVVQALLKLAPHAQVLCYGLFGRSDVPESIVAESNAALRRVVDEVNREGEEGVEKSIGRVRFVEAPSLGDGDFVDHVHLSLSGYQAWDAILWPLVDDCLKKQ